VRLAAKDVTVREGRTKRAIDSVISGSDAPLTVGLVFDTSGSMYKNLLDVQEAAMRFLDTALGPNDRAFLISFDTTARLIQTPTSDRASLRNTIMALRTQGDTALYDAMILGLLQFEGIKGRRAMIVFSDGDDRSSRYETKHVEDLAKRSNIPIYLIAAPPTARPFSNIPARPVGGIGVDNFSAMQSLAGDQWSINFAAFLNVIRSTGGNTHSLRNLKELPEVYEKIEAALRAQSLVLIRTDPGKSENDWRTIDVDVAGRNREVRAPAGYYAPW
jgi:VWFA-related protein